jgi:uncharacterized repeat protein (TIGR03803 family)
MGAALALFGFANVAVAQSFTTIHRFAGAPSPANPNAGVIQGADGNFYGTTQVGGTRDVGTVYRMTPAGVVTVLHSFTGPDGADPFAALVRASDGNFYGSTALGGPGTPVGGLSGNGVIFRISPSGTYTVIHAFDGPSGRIPEAALIQGADGNLYGTTLAGGATGNGTIFRISLGGAFTVLRSFSGADGSQPEAPLAIGPDGNFYGTTAGGGAFNGGVVFRISPAGAFAVLRSFTFTPPDGNTLRGGLALGADGNFYGTTEFGGTHAQGIVFRISPAGAFAVVHSFKGAEGANPITGLTRASDGKFYGVCGFGGVFTNGTLFSMTPAGAVTLLHSFSGGADGALPAGRLIQATGGAIWGTTLLGGGEGSDGTVFRFIPTPGPATTTTAVPVNHPFFTEEDVILSTQATITALTLTITVQRTPGLVFSGMFQNISNQFTQTSVTGPATITYTFVLNPGATVPPGTWTFAAQMGSSGVTHDPNGDAFSLTYISGGQTFDLAGVF